MKIAIIGVGAMGSVYAALLAEAGHRIWAVDPWQAHVDAINTKGLRLEGASGNRIVSGITATTDVTQIEPCDLCIIATKANHVGTATRALAPVIGENTLILTIQNGLGSGERIAEHMVTKNVLLGVADGFGASVKGPGHAHHNAMKLIRIGEVNGGLTRRLHILEEQFQAAGFQAKVFDDITQLMWEKFLCNVTFSAPCTVFDKTVGELMADEDLWSIALGAMQEAYGIARHRNIALSFEDPVAYVTAFGTNMPQARPSMLLDHMAKKASELGAINGMVPVMGRANGLATPYNQTLVAVLKAREAKF
ncbi:MAG: 2-dehydropantoate 2-reductase [Paracoccaceae bacterium]|nr:2-dehydropantoate 2-reductase [Paracoccaceae bacterium]